MEKREYNFYVIESGDKMEGYTDKFHGVVYGTKNMLRVAMVKFLDKDSIDWILRLVDSEAIDPESLDAASVADFITDVFSGIGENSKEEITFETPWNALYRIYRLTPEQVAGYHPDTRPEAVAIYRYEKDDKGEITDSRLKQVVLRKKASDIEYGENEYGIDFIFDEITEGSDI